MVSKIYTSFYKPCLKTGEVLKDQLSYITTQNISIRYLILNFIETIFVSDLIYN